MRDRLFEVIEASAIGRDIPNGDYPVLELISFCTLTSADIPAVRAFQAKIRHDLGIRIVIVSGGFGCTRIRITVEAETPEEAMRSLEKLMSSDLFSNAALEVSFKLLIRPNPYTRKNLLTGEFEGTLPKLPPHSSLAGSQPKKVILFIGVNPRGTRRLRLDEEAKKIEQGLERARQREQFALVHKWAVTDDDLRRALLDHEPKILHFSGHGGGEEGLAFENEQGKVHMISSDSLAKLFSLFSEKLECVVLNACYSEPQATAIARHIAYVVGMRDIGDKVATKFAVGFYDALGAGKNYETAFDFGCSAIDPRNVLENQGPVLLRKWQLVS